MTTTNRPLTALLCLLAAGGLADGATVYWVGPSGGNWGSNANWRDSAGATGAPAAGDDVVIDHDTHSGVNPPSGAYSVRINGNTAGVNSVRVNPRAGSGGAAGTITILMDANLSVSGGIGTSGLYLQPDNGADVVFDNSPSGGNKLRVDTRIKIATGDMGYTAGVGAKAEFGRASATNTLIYDFSRGVNPPTLEIGPNVRVNVRLHTIAGGAFPDMALSWLEVGRGAWLDVDNQDRSGATEHYLRLLGNEAASPGKTLVVHGSGTINVVSIGDDKDILTVQPSSASPYCEFGDAPAAGQAATISGASGYFVVFVPVTWRRAIGSTDSLACSIGTFQLQMSTAAELLTIADDLTVAFTGTNWNWYAGSMTVGTTSANTGTLSWTAAGVGIPGETSMAGQVHALTVRGAAGTRFSTTRNLVLYGDGVGGGGRGRIFVADSGSAQLGNDSLDTVECIGGIAGGGSTGNPGDITVGSTAGSNAVLNAAGALTLTSNTTTGGALIAGENAVANVSGNLNANLSATSGHDGGTVTVSGTARVSVGTNLTVQGNSTGTTVGAKVTVNSTRTVAGQGSEAFAVAGTTNVTAGTVSKGQIQVATDGEVLFQGAVTIGTNGAILDVSDITAPGPVVRFGGDVTVNGSWDPAPAGVWTCVLQGSVAQTFGGTTTGIAFSSLTFAATSARTVTVSNPTTTHTVNGVLGSAGSAAVTVDSAVASKLFDCKSDLTFDGEIAFSGTAAVRLSGTALQTIGGSAATGPTFADLTITNSSGANPSVDYTTTGSTLTVNGTLAVTTNANTLRATSRTIAPKGGVTFGSTFTQSAGEFKLSGAFAQTIGGAAGTGPTFADLTLANTSGASPSVSYTTSGATLTVNGTFKVSSANVLAAASRTIDTKGASAFDATFTQSSGTFRLSSASAQTIGGASATGPTFQDLTLANPAAGTNVTYSTTGSTLTVNGAFTVSNAATVDADARTVSLAGGGTASQNLVVSKGTLRLTAGTLGLAATKTITIDPPATLELAAGASAPTLNFDGAGSTVAVKGTFRTSYTASKPVVTATTAGDTALVLDGAQIDVNGLAYGKGGANGLFVDNTSGAPKFTEFRDVDFTNVGPPPGSRHMRVRAAGGFRMACLNCTFDSNFAAANVRVERNGGTGDTVAAFVRASGSGAGELSDDDVLPAGYAEWFEGGDRLTASPGPGFEDRTDPSTYEGVQGFVTAQWNWFTNAFVGNYALVRTSTDNDGDSLADDLVVKMGDKGQKVYTYAIPHAGAGDKGRVIGPPWTATIGLSGPGVDVVMFVTTKGYIYVLRDTGVALTPYDGYPRQPLPWGGGAPVCDTAYSPLMFYAGGNYLAEAPGDTPSAANEDNFIFCGANAGTNQYYVTLCFDRGREAQCANGSDNGWGTIPGPYPASTTTVSRSWPAFQFPGAGTFLHIATDVDGLGNSHIMRMNYLTGALDQEFAAAPALGGHVRGGMQMPDDPAIPSDARIYVGTYADPNVAGVKARFFSIRTDTPLGSYPQEWATTLGTGDTDMYATYDSGQIYVGDSEGDFYCLNRTAGGLDPDWPTNPVPLDGAAPAADRPIRSSPVIYVNRRGPGTLYVGNDNGKVYQIAVTDGNVAKTWRLGDGRKVRSLSIVEDAGSTYVSAITSDGYVFLMKIAP